MRPLYIFWGKVREGKKRGRNLGYPTANIRLSKQIPSGIYASIISIGNKTYHAATFIGDAKTFNESLYQAEVYILDFNSSIYNQWVSVRLLKKVRDNKKFNSIEALTKQIKEDVDTIRTILSSQ